MLQRKGLSGDSGEGDSDLEKEVGVVAEAVGHALDDLDLVVGAFEQAGVERPGGVGQDARQVRLEAAGEGRQRLGAAGCGAAEPVAPSLFGGAVSKDTESRAWRNVRADWQAWQDRDLAGEDLLRLILDGTAVKVRLDGRVVSIPLLVVIGVRRDGQKILLAAKTMGGETEAAWRAVLDDLFARGLRLPELVIVDGGKGLEAALAGLIPEVPVQRCTVHKERNLLAHAPKHLHEEIKADFTDMMYAANAKAVRARRQAFLTKWRARCRGVADSLEEAGERLFTFLRYPPEQWRSLRTANAVERLHEEFKRRIKTQCALPSPETAAMLFWALVASGQITMRRVDGWQSHDRRPIDQPLDLAA